MQPGLYFNRDQFNTATKLNTMIMTNAPTVVINDILKSVFILSP